MTFSVVARHDMGEYRKVGALVGNFLYAMRLSLGDFNFDAFSRTTMIDGVDRIYMNGTEQRLFWCVWILMTFFSSIVFLTFVIARVTDSYQTILDDLGKIMYKEKCSLIFEAENLVADKKDAIKFPTYIILRDLE